MAPVLPFAFASTTARPRATTGETPSHAAKNRTIKTAEFAISAGSTSLDAAIKIEAVHAKTASMSLDDRASKATAENAIGLENAHLKDSADTDFATEKFLANLAARAARTATAAGLAGGAETRTNIGLPKGLSATEKKCATLTGQSAPGSASSVFPPLGEGREGRACQISIRSHVNVVRMRCESG